MRSLLLRLERRRIFTRAQSDAALRLLTEIEVLVEPAETLVDLDPIVRLARSSRITPYDAFYLDLAMQADADLASRDAVLLTAAVAANISVHDLRN